MSTVFLNMEHVEHGDGSRVSFLAEILWKFERVLRKELNLVWRITLVWMYDSQTRNKIYIYFKRKNEQPSSFFET